MIKQFLTPGLHYEINHLSLQISICESSDLTSKASLISASQLDFPTWMRLHFGPLLSHVFKYNQIGLSTEISKDVF